jgi:hypothetical protein
MEATHINNERLQKLDSDIGKIKAKISEYTARLRELERQRTETENAGIVALVRDIDITPDELMAFIQKYKGHPAAMETVIPPAAKNEMEGADEDI